jgi:transcriptional regulator with XRE-family HTH domain
LAAATYQRERRRLSERLRLLRQEAGISGNQFAKRLGWPQSKVSKIETAKQLPTEEDIRHWVNMIGAPDEVVGELLLLLRRARVEYATWKENYLAAGGAAGKQADILALESRMTRIGEFQPAFVPGLVQTAEYARELQHLPSGPLAFGGDEADIAQMVANRMRRQQVLYTPGKRVQLIMLEGALRTRVCSAVTLAGQLDRLIAVIGLPTLELGILPFEGDVPVLPINAFWLYDEDLVVIETLTGEQQLSEPDEIALYDRFFELLRNAARKGPEAVAIIQRALSDLRRSES